MILNSKGLDDRVSGEAAEPADKTRPEWKKWNAINSLIVAWAFFIHIGQVTQMDGAL